MFRKPKLIHFIWEETANRLGAKHAALSEIFLETNTVTWNRLPQDVLVQGDEDGGMAVGQGPQPQGQVTLAEQVIGHVHPVCNRGRRASRHCHRHHFGDILLEDELTVHPSIFLYP